jgi:hypothetical protein
MDSEHNSHQDNPETITEETNLAQTKQHTNNLSFEKTNLYLNIGIKIIILVSLTFSFGVGVSIYSKYSHDGPKCQAQVKNLNYWINKKSPGEIVSVHENKLQNDTGTTKCFGTFQKPNGGYTKWDGKITELSDGTIVGGASI